jgi:hypothetical protein
MTAFILGTISPSLVLIVTSVVLRRRGRPRWAIAMSIAALVVTCSIGLALGWVIAAQVAEIVP